MIFCVMLPRCKTTSLFQYSRRDPYLHRRVAISLLLITGYSITLGFSFVRAGVEDTLSSTVRSIESSTIMPLKIHDPLLLSTKIKKIAQKDQKLINAILKSHEATKQDSNITKDEDTDRSSLLPFWAEEAKKRGYELPRPLGVSGSFFFGTRDIEVDSADVAIGNVTLPVDKYASIDVKSKEKNWSTRFDAWIFPFLNVYFLAGYTIQQTDVDIDPHIGTVLPLLPPLVPNHIGINLDLDGITYGGGTTLAGGNKQFFFVVDANYTISDLEGEEAGGLNIDQQVDALLVSIRIGRRTSFRKTKLNLWLGGTYWGIGQTVDGKAEVPLLGDIDFEIEESPAHHFSAHIGSHIEFTQHFNFLCDVGSNFSDIFTITPALMYRF